MKQKLHIIKIGGNVLDDPAVLEAFLKDFSGFEGLNILVHGGGKIATSLGHRLGIRENMVDGRRITNAETLELVTMVYGGLINKGIVARLQSMGCNAIGLSGADANILPAVKRPVKEIDYGYVGDIIDSALHAARLQPFLDASLSLVIAPLTHDGKGNLLNTNADTIASSLARMLSSVYETELFYCFEKEGVLDTAGKVIVHINEKIFADLRESQVVSAGMIPKIQNALDALKGGVQTVHILKADVLHEVINLQKEKGTAIRL